MTHKPALILLLLYLIISGCRQPVVTPTPMTCNGYTLRTAVQPHCIGMQSGTVIQTALNQQAQVTIDPIELTIKGTIYVQVSDNLLSVAVLEGTAIIGLDNTIITLSSRQQLEIDGNSVGDIHYYDYDTLIDLPLDQLERSIDVVQPTPTEVIVATPAPDCPLPDNWTDQYIVQPGDTLTTISQAVDVTLEELQKANCIDNPNNVRVGLVLNVPQGTARATQPSETFTPSAVLFRADRETIDSGECTTLRWDVQNVRTVQLDETIISGQTSQEICPSDTTTYTLSVNYFDDTQSQHHVTVHVNSP